MAKKNNVHKRRRDYVKRQNPAFFPTTGPQPGHEAIQAEYQRLIAQAQHDRNPEPVPEPTPAFVHPTLVTLLPETSAPIDLVHVAETSLEPKPADLEDEFEPTPSAEEAEPVEDSGANHAKLEHDVETLRLQEEEFTGEPVQIEVEVGILHPQEQESNGSPVEQPVQVEDDVETMHPQEQEFARSPIEQPVQSDQDVGSLGNVDAFAAPTVQHSHAGGKYDPKIDPLIENMPPTATLKAGNTTVESTASSDVKYGTNTNVKGTTFADVSYVWDANMESTAPPDANYGRNTNSETISKEAASWTDKGSIGPNKPGFGNPGTEHSVEEAPWKTVRPARRQSRIVVGGAIPNTQGCYNCGRDGHRKNECPEPPKLQDRSCYKCGEDGHISRDCPSAQSSGTARVCYNCNEMGHISRDCLSGGSTNSGNRGCYTCGEDGHRAAQCPQKAGDNGRPRHTRYPPRHFEAFDSGVQDSGFDNADGFEPQNLSATGAYMAEDASGEW